MCVCAPCQRGAHIRGRKVQDFSEGECVTSEMLGLFSAQEQ